MTDEGLKRKNFNCLKRLYYTLKVWYVAFYFYFMIFLPILIASVWGLNTK
jgi:hypothetical protein